MRNTLAAVLLAALLATPAAAHYRMLGTENLDTIGERRYQLEVGAEYRDRENFPFSGLTGDYVSVGNLSFEMGLGENAAAWIRGTPYQRLSIDRRVAAPNSPNLRFTGNTTDSVGDFSFGTKIRFTRPEEGKVGFGFQFAVQMPNVPNQKGLGNDETNFYGTFLGETRAGDTEIFANVGLAILPDPVVQSTQRDKILYGLGFATPIADEWKLLGDVSGTNGSGGPGTEDRSVARLGVMQTEGEWMWDAGVRVGLENVDADWGVTAGVTHQWGR